MLGPYTILGVAESASLDEIESAYHDKLSKQDPVRGGDTGAFEQIRNAYEQILSERQARRFGQSIVDRSAASPSAGPSEKPAEIEPTELVNRANSADRQALELLMSLHPELREQLGAEPRDYLGQVLSNPWFRAILAVAGAIGPLCLYYWSWDVLWSWNKGGLVVTLSGFALFILCVCLATSRSRRGDNVCGVIGLCLLACHVYSVHRYGELLKDLQTAVEHKDRDGAIKVLKSLGIRGVIDKSQRQVDE